MSNQDSDLRAQLQSFAAHWKGFRTIHEPSPLPTRFLAVQTNGLEGVFKLTSDNSLGLVRLPETVEISSRTTVYLHPFNQHSG